MPELNIYI